jgi:hypothetical protein
MTDWRISPCKRYVYKKNQSCPDIDDGRCHGSCDVGLRGEDCFYETSDKISDLAKVLETIHGRKDVIKHMRWLGRDYKYQLLKMTLTSLWKNLKYLILTNNKKLRFAAIRFQTKKFFEIFFKF